MKINVMKFIQFKIKNLISFLIFIIFNLTNLTHTIIIKDKRNDALLIEEYKDNEVKEIHNFNEKYFINDLEIHEKMILMNIKLIIKDIEKENKLNLNLESFSNSYSEKKLIIDTINPNSFLFKNESLIKENNFEYFFHFGLKNVTFQKDVDFSRFYLIDNKNKNENKTIWKINDFSFQNIYLDNKNKSDEIINFKNEILFENKSDIIGTISFSRETNDKEIFNKINNKGFYSEDFAFDLKNKKLIFGIMEEYKNSIFSKLNIENLNNNQKKENEIENIKPRFFCKYKEKDFLVINKKKKFHNCHVSYLYLGDEFNGNIKEGKVLNNFTNLDNNKMIHKPIAVNKIGIFDTFTKYIMFPIEKIDIEGREAYNYIEFFSKIVNKSSEIYKNTLKCFIIEENLISFSKKSLICLSKYKKDHILNDINEYFLKQNIILNTISINLNSSLLLDEIDKENFYNNFNNDKYKIFSLNSSIKDSNNTLNITEILNNSNDYTYIFEYNIVFYDEKSIINFMKEKSHLLKNDNIFEYENNPVILGTTFILHFNQIFFKESENMIEFFGGEIINLESLLDNEDNGFFSSFIFSTLSVILLILLIIFVPYYFYRRRKRILMEKLQYEIIYKKIEDVSNEWFK
jgi:hypothetical protein